MSRWITLNATFDGKEIPESHPEGMNSYRPEYSPSPDLVVTRFMSSSSTSEMNATLRRVASELFEDGATTVLALMAGDTVDWAEFRGFVRRDGYTTEIDYGQLSLHEGQSRSALDELESDFEFIPDLGGNYGRADNYL